MSSNILHLLNFRKTCSEPGFLRGAQTKVLLPLMVVDLLLKVTQPTSRTTTPSRFGSLVILGLVQEVKLGPQPSPLSPHVHCLAARLSGNARRQRPITSVCRVYGEMVAGLGTTSCAELSFPFCGLDFSLAV